MNSKSNINKYLTTQDILSAIANNSYGGRILNDVYNTEISHYSSEWEWIKSRISENRLQGIYPADLIITNMVGGGVIYTRILGINTYKNAMAGFSNYGSKLGIVPNHIDFSMHTAIINNTSSAPFNLCDTNNGSKVSKSPWLASNMYAWLNGLSQEVPNTLDGNGLITNYVLVDYTENSSTPGFYWKLPKSLRDVIYPKQMHTPCRYNINQALTNDSDIIWNANMGQLWLLSEIEVFGCIRYGTVTNSISDIHYELFRNSNAFRQINIGSSLLLTAISGKTNNMLVINTDGTLNQATASSNKYVRLGFRIIG